MTHELILSTSDVHALLTQDSRCHIYLFIGELVFRNHYHFDSLHSPEWQFTIENCREDVKMFCRDHCQDVVLRLLIIVLNGTIIKNQFSLLFSQIEHKLMFKMTFL